MDNQKSPDTLERVSRILEGESVDLTGNKPEVRRILEKIAAAANMTIEVRDNSATGLEFDGELTVDDVKRKLFNINPDLTAKTVYFFGGIEKREKGGVFLFRAFDKEVFRNIRPQITRAENASDLVDLLEGILAGVRKAMGNIMHDLRYMKLGVLDIRELMREYWKEIKECVNDVNQILAAENSDIEIFIATAGLRESSDVVTRSSLGELKTEPGRPKRSNLYVCPSHLGIRKRSNGEIVRQAAYYTCDEV